MRNLLLFCWAGAPLLRSLLGSPGAGGEPGKPRFDETHEKASASKAPVIMHRLDSLDRAIDCRDLIY